jgi:hypothetical protein
VGLLSFHNHLNQYFIITLSLVLFLQRNLTNRTAPSLWQPPNLFSCIASVSQQILICPLTDTPWYVTFYQYKSNRKWITIKI